MFGMSAYQESLFRRAFRACLDEKPRVAPGPTQLNRNMVALGSERRVSNQIGGRESKLRIQLLESHGFAKDKKTGRWNRVLVGD